MASIKCVSCGLVNFATVQFCKRCNNSLSQPTPVKVGNETQIISHLNNTSVRPTVPLPNNFQPNNGQQNISQPPSPPPPPINSAPISSTSIPHHSATLPPPPTYNPPPSSGNYQASANGSEWTLPRFPKDQRPPQYQNQYQEPRNHHQHQHQYPPHNQYFINEVPYKRYGKDVVLHERATLPSACVKCGKRISSALDGEIIAQKFRWHHPLVYIALLSPLIYLILALVLSKTIFVNIPLCHEHAESRRSVKNILIGSGIVAALMVVGLIFFEAAGFAFLVLFLTIIGLSLVHKYAYNPLGVRKIEENYYHLTGASEEYLNFIPY